MGVVYVSTSNKTSKVCDQGRGSSPFVQQAMQADHPDRPSITWAYKQARTSSVQMLLCARVIARKRGRKEAQKEGGRLWRDTGDVRSAGFRALVALQIRHGSQLLQSTR
jgi:hypothetical protein